MQPEKAEVLTLATCALHNYLRRHKVGDVVPDSDFADDGGWRQVQRNGIGNLNANNIGNNYSHAASQTRDAFCAYFNGPGAVGWQNDMV